MMQLRTQLKQRTTQKHVFSHRQHYALNILAMSDIQLQKEIEHKIEENPLLDYDEIYFHHEDMFEYASKLSYVKETLKDVLYYQLHTCNECISYEVASYLIELIDSNGYLPKQLYLPFPYEEDQLEEIIAVLQTFEPSGVFARDLQECLLIQLCLHESPYAQVATMIVYMYMNELANHQLQTISDHLHLPLLEIQFAVSLIRSLQPKPGAMYAIEMPFVTIDADIYVEDATIHIKMKLSSSFLTINHQYDNIKDEVALAYIQRAMKDATVFIACIDKRNATLSAILTSICDYQSDFFLHHKNVLPLTLRDIAQRIHFHESTISRAISQKYIRFEERIYPMKYFFPSALESGQSSSHMKQRIQDIIQSEQPTKPYSDKRLADVLMKEGYIISRRTIAKYRDQMHILPSYKRKVFK